MTALDKDRKTDERLFLDAVSPLEYGVAAATKMYGGAIGCLNAAGAATKGAVATTLIAVGRVEAVADNTDGAAGDIKARIKPGIYKWANSAAADEITDAEIGDNCYIVDDQTVGKTDGTATRSIAGKIIDVDSDGVWVATGFKFVFG